MGAAGKGLQKLGVGKKLIQFGDDLERGALGIKANVKGGATAALDADALRNNVFELIQDAGQTFDDQGLAQTFKGISGELGNVLEASQFTTTKDALRQTFIQKLTQEATDLEKPAVAKAAEALFDAQTQGFDDILSAQDLALIKRELQPVNLKIVKAEKAHGMFDNLST